MDVPGGSVLKNLPANAGDKGSNSRSGRCPGEETGSRLQYSCLGILAWTEKPGGLQSMGSQKRGRQLRNQTTAMYKHISMYNRITLLYTQH